MMSRYLRTRRKNGMVAIFHELHPNPVFIREETWRVFVLNTMPFPDLEQSLQSRGLIVDTAEKDDREYQETCMHVGKKLDEPRILYLMLAQGCNMSCSYCPIPALAEKYGEHLLSGDDARAGLDLWCEHIAATGYEGEGYIIFYGGEPLLNKQTLATALQDIAELFQSGRLIKERTRLMLATNATLFDEPTLELCKKHQILVSVGIDNPDPEEPTLRIYRDGQKSTADATKTIKWLISKGVDVSISTTITPQNVERIPSIAARWKQLGVKGFGLNFLRGSALKEIHDIVRFESRAATALVDLLQSEQNASFEYQIHKKVSAYRTRSFYPVDCTCYGNQLVIQPNGQVSNCPFMKAELGHVQTLRGSGFKIHQTAVVSEWRKRLPLFDPNNELNGAQALSGAGCAWGCADRTGDVLSPDTALNQFTREVFDALLWSEYVPTD